jgi:heme A synthase
MAGKTARQESTSIEKPATSLEARSKKIALAFSLIALGLMVCGFAGSVAYNGFTLPGCPVLPFSALGRLSLSSAGMRCMSIGIILLATFPTVRVIIALWRYSRSGDMLDTIVALVILMELALSIWIR